MRHIGTAPLWRKTSSTALARIEGITDALRRRISLDFLVAVLCIILSLEYRGRLKICQELASGLWD